MKIYKILLLPFAAVFRLFNFVGLFRFAACNSKQFFYKADSSKANKVKQPDCSQNWNCINHKYAYTVEFDSEELVRNCINAIDSQLNVTRLIYTVEQGEQKTEMIKEDVEHGASFRAARTHSDTIKSFASDTLVYDLIGKIRENTQLTRRTVAKILKGITASKFSLFQVNPEEFIKKVAHIINEQKASIIVEHVMYNKTDEAPFDSEIFNQAKG